MNPRSDRGFTLVEVLVTTVIVGTALVVLIQGFALGVRAGATADRQSEAARVFEEVVARIEMAEIPLTKDSEGEWDDVAPGYHWAVALETPGDPVGLTVARITVAWGADDRGTNAAGTLAAERWFWRPPTSETGGVQGASALGSGSGSGGGGS